MILMETIMRNIEKGHTIEEYMKRFGDKYDAGELWDFLESDMKDGAIEVNPDIVYWEIDGRYYETDIPFSEITEGKKGKEDKLPTGDPEKNMAAFNHMMGSDCCGDSCEGSVCEAVMEDRVASYNSALELAKKLNKPVVYGYTKGGKYFSVKPKEYHGDDKAFRSQYSANVVLVAYPDKPFAKAAGGAEKTESLKLELKELDDPHLIVIFIQHYKEMIKREEEFLKEHGDNEFIAKATENRLGQFKNDLNDLEKKLDEVGGVKIYEGVEADSPEKRFIEILNEMEFSLVRNDDGTFGVHDLQGVNLGDIEHEKYDSAYGILDRMSGTYMNDYFIEPEYLPDLIEDEDYPKEGIWSAEEFCKWYTPEMRKKYPDLEYRWDVCDFYLNRSKDVDLEKAYRYQEGE